MDLMQSLKVSSSGMLGQSQRMKVAAENIANADSLQRADGEGPYRAKQVVFKSVLNRVSGLNELQASVQEDNISPLRPEYRPGHELADARGFVLLPNVDSTVESLNMREAQRSYEANMAAITTARDMMGRSLDMLR